MTVVVTDTTALLTTLQAMLAGEHAAVYAYGVLGGRLAADTSLQRLASTGYVEHRARRDAVLEMVRVTGGEPVPPEVGYDLPVPVDDPAQARTLAQRVEDRCSMLYADVVAAATDSVRGFAIAALVDAATRALSWGADATALPGVRLVNGR